MKYETWGNPHQGVGHTWITVQRWHWNRWWFRRKWVEYCLDCGKERRVG